MTLEELTDEQILRAIYVRGILIEYGNSLFETVTVSDLLFETKFSTELEIDKGAVYFKRVVCPEEYQVHTVRDNYNCTVVLNKRKAGTNDPFESYETYTFKTLDDIDFVLRILTRACLFG